MKLDGLPNQLLVTGLISELILGAMFSYESKLTLIKNKKVEQFH